MKYTGGRQNDFNVHGYWRRPGTPRRRHRRCTGSLLAVCWQFVRSLFAVSVPVQQPGDGGPDGGSVAVHVRAGHQESRQQRQAEQAGDIPVGAGVGQIEEVELTHADQIRLGVDVEVILTPPCIFCMGNH